jgi:hypothetical protein
MSADLEYLEEMFRRMRHTDRIQRSFTVIKCRLAANGNQGARGAKTNSESVGSKSSVIDPPGM